MWPRIYLAVAKEAEPGLFLMYSELVFNKTSVSPRRKKDKGKKERKQGELTMRQIGEKVGGYACHRFISIKARNTKHSIP